MTPRKVFAGLMRLLGVGNPQETRIKLAGRPDIRQSPSQRRIYLLIILACAFLSVTICDKESPKCILYCFSKAYTGKFLGNWRQGRHGVTEGSRSSGFCSDKTLEILKESVHILRVSCGSVRVHCWPAVCASVATKGAGAGRISGQTAGVTVPSPLMQNPDRSG